MLCSIMVRAGYKEEIKSQYCDKTYYFKDHKYWQSLLEAPWKE